MVQHYDYSLSAKVIWQIDIPKAIIYKFLFYLLIDVLAFWRKDKDYLRKRNYFSSWNWSELDKAKGLTSPILKRI